MICLDSSALVKLVVEEPESGALRSFARERPVQVASAVVAVEVPRAVRRASAVMLPAAERLVEQLDLVAATEEILSRAARVDPPQPRALDAVHLATALSLGDELEALVTYDARLAAAARAAGVRVAAPS